MRKLPLAHARPPLELDLIVEVDLDKPARTSRARRSREDETRGPGSGPTPKVTHRVFLLVQEPGARVWVVGAAFLDPSHEAAQQRDPNLVLIENLPFGLCRVATISRSRDFCL